MITVDPGARALGVCNWKDSQILRVELVRTKGRTVSSLCENLPPTPISKYSLGICEQMNAGGSRVPPNDLIKVAIVGATYTSRFCEKVKYVLPRIWKGRLPKRVHHARILKVLNPREQSIINECFKTIPRTHQKEILDAVGIGLWYHKRRI